MKLVIFRTVAVLVVVGALLLVAYRLGFDSARIDAWAEGLRSHNDVVTNALIFVSVWGIGTSVGFPGLPLMTAGGILFGTLAGTVLSLVGTTLGALGGYSIARLIAHDAVGRWIERHAPQLALSDQTGFMPMLWVRLTPLPIAVVSFAGGVAGVAVLPYLAATLLGQLPSTLAYSYLGDRLFVAMRRGGSGGSGGQLGRDLALISAGLLVLTCLPFFFRRLWPRQDASDSRPPAG